MHADFTDYFSFDNQVLHCHQCNEFPEEPGENTSDLDDIKLYYDNFKSSDILTSCI